MCHYHFKDKRELTLALIVHARRDWVEPLEEPRRQHRSQHECGRREVAADDVIVATPTDMDAVAEAAEADAVPEAAKMEAVAKAMAEADAKAAGEALPRIAVDRSAAPVRFVWKTDADGRFVIEHVVILGANGRHLIVRKKSSSGRSETLLILDQEPTR
jgi:hypothetical protein